MNQDNTANKTVFTLEADGATHAKGDFTLVTPDGSEEPKTELFLCRCGTSKTMPLCDNSHLKSGFRAGGGLGNDSTRPVNEETPKTVRLRGRPDGPLVAEGPCKIVSEDGGTIHEGGQVALCRCGASANKPYCDGSHKKVGFKAE